MPVGSGKTIISIIYEKKICGCQPPAYLLSILVLVTGSLVVVVIVISNDSKNSNTNSNRVREELNVVKQNELKNKNVLSIE